MRHTVTDTELWLPVPDNEEKYCLSMNFDQAKSPIDYLREMSSNNSAAEQKGWEKTKDWATVANHLRLIL
jgi:hypothetical protein